MFTKNSWGVSTSSYCSTQCLQNMSGWETHLWINKIVHFTYGIIMILVVVCAVEIKDWIGLNLSLIDLFFKTLDVWFKLEEEFFFHHSSETKMSVCINCKLFSSIHKDKDSVVYFLLGILDNINFFNGLTRTTIFKIFEEKSCNKRFFKLNY